MMPCPLRPAVLCSILTWLRPHLLLPAIVETLPLPAIAPVLPGVPPRQQLWARSRRLNPQK